MNMHQILLANNLLSVPEAEGSESASRAEVATVLSNMAYFGFVPSLDVLKRVQCLSSSELSNFWAKLNRELRELTKANRNMDKHVVYKNFPKEVLDMTQAEYWFNQVLMYLGAPNEWFQQSEGVREPLRESLKLKVLGLATDSSLWEIFQALVANRARWTDAQREHAQALLTGGIVTVLDVSDFGFKENGVTLAASWLGKISVVVREATDGLRLAAAMSGADVALKDDVKFRAFKRSERRILCNLLEASKNLEQDFAMRATLWKKLLSKLHPGDFKNPRLSAAYDALYNGKLLSFNATVESNLFIQHEMVLEQLQARPGEFVRRLHKMYEVFGMSAVTSFVKVMPKLSTTQLLKLQGYLRSINLRQYLLYAPKGNWNKVKVVGNEKAKFSSSALQKLLGAIGAEMHSRMVKAFPKGIALGAEVMNVKLQTNDQELAPYGRGTVFPIPANMKFVRTASYWAHQTRGNTWFDNGWNFFDENWSAKGACCWNATSVYPGAAVFSGDPTNSKDLKGRACQMIDLNLAMLERAGIRYAVWNILAYSRVPFSDAEEVLATLQWGENAQEGKLYEPARAQMVFPLKGKNLTKYVALIDVKLRELVYLDANLKGEVSSANSNSHVLSQTMPAFMEYLQALPSVADLFEEAPEGSTAVVYSDADVSLVKGEKAYVFKPENPNNSFTPLRLEEVL